MSDTRTPLQRRHDRRAMCVGLVALFLGAWVHSPLFITCGVLLMLCASIPWPKENE
jgi:hypothetical protein